MKMTPVPYDVAKKIVQAFNGKEKELDEDLSWGNIHIRIYRKKGVTPYAYAIDLRNKDTNLPLKGDGDYIKSIKLTKDTFIVKLAWRSFEFPLIAPDIEEDPSPALEETIDPELLVKGLEAVLLAKVRNCEDSESACRYLEALKCLNKIKEEL